MASPARAHDDDPSYDYDWLVVGSGFGGSVAAHRLTREGLPRRGPRVRPALRRRRVPALDVGPAALLLRAAARACTASSACRCSRTSRSSAAPASAAAASATPTRCTAPGRASTPTRSGRASRTDWEAALAPHFDEAERMLGVTTVLTDDPADDLLREFGRHIGADKTYAKTRVGVFFGTPGETVADPFFGGAGPARTGCIACGRCMVGCPVGAKNTLVKNYLWLAEHAGCRILPEREVVDVRPLGARDGSDGYAVTTERTGAWLRKDRRTHDGAQRRARRRPAGHEQAAAALPPQRLAAERLAPPRRARAHQQRGDPRRDRARRQRRLHQARRDLGLDLPRREHPHRDRQLRPRRRLDEPAAHAARSATARSSRAR